MPRLPGDLCQKGYSRITEFEAHESSYDHQHKKRLKDMKAMQRDPNASSKARRAERKADEQSGLISIKPLKLGGGAGGAAGGAGGAGASKPGFKKSGFKSAFAPADAAADEAPKPAGFKKAFAADQDAAAAAAAAAAATAETVDDDSDDVGYEYYDPRRPTECSVSCGWNR
jgi:hypothetical protein